MISISHIWIFAYNGGTASFQGHCLTFRSSELDCRYDIDASIVTKRETIYSQPVLIAGMEFSSYHQVCRSVSSNCVGIVKAQRLPVHQNVVVDVQQVHLSNLATPGHLDESYS